MFGFHAISETPFSAVAAAPAGAGTTHAGEASLGNIFGFDDGFSAGFEVEPAVLNATASMTLVGSSLFARGFGLNADGNLLSDLTLALSHLGAASLQSDSIFSSKGVLISVGKANLVGGSNLGVSDLTNINLSLYIDQARSITNYVDQQKGIVLYLDRELSDTFRIDQNSSKTSYIDKELSMEI